MSRDDRKHLRICIACPAPSGSRQGNRVSAARWKRILRSLGHHVSIVSSAAAPRDADVLLALHARRSARIVAAFRARYPDRRIILALTGTDLYHDLPLSRAAQRSVALADQVVVLQPMALRRLTPAARVKARVIFQSVSLPRSTARKSDACFDVCVLSHLRAVKDPLRAAFAARLLPRESRVRILHAGRALTSAFERRARAEVVRNARYRWLRERSRAATLRLLSRCGLLVVSSTLEGGANVVGEAAVCGVPILASRIDGNVGLLGADYPGYFPVGDTVALARLLHRAEVDRRFYGRLQRGVDRIAARFDVRREAQAWKNLLATIASRRQ